MTKLQDIMLTLAAWKEAATRPGVLSRDGWKLAVQMRGALAGYFTTLVKHAELADATDNHYGLIEPHISALLRKAQPTLLLIYHAHALKAFRLEATKPVYTGSQIYPVTVNAKEADDGAQASASAAYSSPGAQAVAEELYSRVDRLGLTGKEAVDYITAHGAELVDGLDAYSIKVMRSLIAKGIEQQLGVQGTMRLIREEFGEMSRSRARSIATTEINDAMSEAALRKVKAVGLDGKRWIRSPGACPICEANAAQGIIPVDDYFQSGHKRPPAHPGKCRCAVAGARLPKTEEK